jgi:hypothetical protein
MSLDHDKLTQELGLVREKGLPRLRRLDLPQLSSGAQQLDLQADVDGPSAIEELIRRAVAALGGGDYGEAASAMMGLATGTRGLGPRQRRERAGDLLEMSESTFRTRHQAELVRDIANQVLMLVGERAVGSSKSATRHKNQSSQRDTPDRPPDAAISDSRRKLQVFISSTYEDMKEERQCAVEAILEAGHIPAGMELFTSGDSSQWKVIEEWILECDAFVLLLCGRYGSIEPESGKSYVHLEYEFAQEHGIPTMAFLGNAKFMNKKFKSMGLQAMEQKNPSQLEAFKGQVLQHHVKYFENRKNLKYEISLALRAVEARPGIRGWIREQPKSELTLSFPSRSVLFGTGLHNELEGSHNYYRIESYIRTDLPDNVLIIGSPYLRYWFDSSDSSRMERILVELPELSAEVVLFTPTGSGSAQSSSQRESTITAMENVEQRFPKRLKCGSTDTQTDVSYISYTMIPEGASMRMRRLLVGLQFAPYSERPFFELVSPIDEPDHVSAAIMAFHNKSLGSA